MNTDDNRDTDTDRDDRLDYEDMTAEERAVIEGSNDEGEAPRATAPPTEDADPAPAAPSGNDEAADIREAAQAMREAAEAIKAASPKQEQAPPADDPAPPAARDYNAELNTLRQRYEDGELEQAEYLDLRDEVRDARLRDQIRQEQVQSEQERAQERWAQAYTTFASDEANQRLMTGVLKPGFDQLALQNIQSGMDYEAALAAARDTIFDQLGLAKPGAKERADKVADAVAQRAPKERPGPTLRDAPAADRDRGTNPNDDWDSLPIEELEKRLATASPERIEAYLADAPGGLRDNPKYRED